MTARSTFLLIVFLSSFLSLFSEDKTKSHLSFLFFDLFVASKKRTSERRVSALIEVRQGQLCCVVCFGTVQKPQEEVKRMKFCAFHVSLSCLASIKREFEWLSGDSGTQK